MEPRVRSVSGWASAASGAPPVQREASLAPGSVIDPRIDVFAQRALQRMMASGDPAVQAGVGMLGAVKRELLAGIYKEDEQVPALRARRLGMGWWQAIPSGEDAALMFDADGTTGRPIVVFRDRVRSQPAGLDPALRKAFRSFTLHQGGQLVRCPPGGGVSTEVGGRVPVPNIVPPILCHKPLEPVVPVVYQPPEPVVPIFILPGIMGTRLQDPQTGACVWNPTALPGLGGHGPFAANVARLEDPAPLQPIPSHHHPVQDPDFQAAEQVGNFGNLVPDFYDELSFGLNDAGFRAGLRRRFGIDVVVIACGYDWRQDNRVSAQDVKQCMLRVMNRLAAPKCIVVAHSMGGLVARWICRHLKGEKVVRSLLLLGSPTHGSPQAYRLLREGPAPMEDGKLTLGLFPLTSRGRLRSMLRGFTSAYQLMPTSAFCKAHPQWVDFRNLVVPPPLSVPADASDPVSLYANPHVELLDENNADPSATRARLDARRAFDAGLECYLPPGTRIVCCSNLDTEQGYLIDGNARSQPRFRIAPRLASGDGTVPGFSGCGRLCEVGVPRHELPAAAHDALPNDPRVILLARDVVTNAVEGLQDILRPERVGRGV